MSRTMIITLAVGSAVLLGIWILWQQPDLMSEALAHPFAALAGTGEQLNSTLLEASEVSEPVRAAGLRLLQPWGLVHLVRIYPAADTEPTKKH